MFEQTVQSSEQARYLQDELNLLIDKAQDEFPDLKAARWIPARDIHTSMLPGGCMFGLILTFMVADEATRDITPEQMMRYRYRQTVLAIFLERECSRIMEAFDKAFPDAINMLRTQVEAMHLRRRGRRNDPEQSVEMTSMSHALKMFILT